MAPAPSSSIPTGTSCSSGDANDETPYRAASSKRAPDLRPTGISAGLHLAAWLPPDLDDTEVVAAAAHRGLRVYGLGPYRLTDAGDPGLIFGYASLTEPTIARGIAILADVIATLRSAPTFARSGG